MTGPRSGDPGYDYVLQGMAGWMDVTGEPDGPPTKSGLSVVDYSGGLVAAVSLLAALHAARRDGVGADCDVSLFDTAVSMLTYPAAWALNSDFEPTRTHHSAHPSLVPFQAFPSADGWIVVACPKEKFWRRLTGALGAPELADDPRYASFELRRANSQSLLPVLEAALIKRSTQEWLDVLRAVGVPCGPVNSVREALADPHTTARQMLVRTEHPHFGPLVQVSTAVRVGDERPDGRRAPRLNEDVAAVLSGLLGYTPEQRQAFGVRGAFGTPPTAAEAAPS